MTALAVRATIDRKRRSMAMLLLIVAGGALLRFYRLSTESFWFDEAYSVWVARHSVGWQLALSTERIFPPLYYLLLHFWLMIGSGDWIVRMLSALTGVVSLLLVYALGKRLLDESVGLLSAFLLAISPLHVWYSQEARMYALVALLGLCSAYFVWRSLEEGRAGHWLAYVLSTAAAVSTHYFALFLLPFQNVYVFYLLIRRRAVRRIWKTWLVSQVAIVLLSLLALVGVFSDESRYWWGLLDVWHGAPTLTDLLHTLFAFSLGTTVANRWLYLVGLGVFGLCGAWSMVALRGRRLALVLDDGLVFALLYLAVPVGTIFVMSQFRSSWVLRYLFPFMPPYCIILARGVMQVPQRWGRVVITGMLVVLSLWPLASTYRDRQKEDWRSAAQHVMAQERPGDAMLMVAEDIWLPFDHYYRGSIYRQGIGGTITDRSLLAAHVGLAASSYRRIWLVLSHTENVALKDYLLTSGYANLVSEKYFHLVEVDLFEVAPSFAGGS